MSVGTFQQPNNETQGGTAYKTNIDNCFAVLARLAGAFAPHEQAVPNMTVLLDAGALFGAGVLTNVASQSTAAITAPVSNPRIDRVVIDQASGGVSVIAGVEAASPSPPALPAGKLPNCQMLLSPSTAAITNALITDERVAGAPAASYAFAVGAIYLSVDSTNPATSLGYGAWQQFGFGRMLVGYGAVPIGALSQAAACVVTWQGHGLNNGDSVTFSGITQTGWTPLNATFMVTRLDADHFSIPVNTSGYPGAYNAATDPGIGTIGGANFNTVEQTGGGTGSHTHSIPAGGNSLGALTCSDGLTGATPETSDGTAHVFPGITVGGGNTGDPSATVLSPFITVYMWKRTA